MTEPEALLVREATQALLEGRFRECERLAAMAAQLAPTAPAPGPLAISALREQGRVAEAEIMARGFLGDHPDDDEGLALLGALLADLGRDGEARRQLDLLDGRHRHPVVTALAAEVVAALDSPRDAEALLGPLVAHAGVFAGCHGSVFRHLGLVCHVLGRWDEAEANFDLALAANEAAGAPVLVAHTCRHYAALLRARGEDDDWERAIELLTQAAAIYRRLGVERLAEEAEVVLRRSQEMAPVMEVGDPPNVFRRAAAGWELAYRGERASVPDTPGLRHVAALLAADGRPVHAVDLVESHVEAAVGDQVVTEYRARLAEVDAQLVAADPLAAALARAERDFLRAELAVLDSGPPLAAEVGDRARRLVALRVRTCLDEMEGVLPALARHLRRSIRTGTFCMYEPDGPERWKMGP